MSLDLDLIYPEFNFKMGKSSNNKVYRFDQFRLDGTCRMLYFDDSPVTLAPKAVETLLALVERRGEIVSKDELMNAIWADTIVEESNLAQYLYVLRKTLGANQEGSPFIETLRRRGYRFNGDVQISESLPQNGALSQVVPQPKPVPLHSIEQHGNVLRFVDRRPPETSKPELVPQLATAEPTRTRNKLIRLASVVAVCAVVISLFAFSYMRPMRSAAGEPRSPKSDITITRLTNGSAPIDATISPKGDYFVYHEQDGETMHLWLQQVGLASRVELTPPMKKFPYGKTISPDGSFVYFVAGDDSNAIPALYRVPTLGGSVSKVLNNVYGLVSFSPNGKQIVFLRLDRQSGDSALVIADASGGNESVVVQRTKAQGVLGLPAWSPDGSSIAFSSSTPDGDIIERMSVRSNHVDVLSPEKWATCYRKEWTRDGTGLVFVGTRQNEGTTTRRDQIYLLSVESGRSTRLTTDGNRYQTSSLGITENDEILAVPSNRSSQIWEMSPSGDTRTAVQITSGLADGRAGLAALPNGRIVYNARVGDNLAVLAAEADGSAQKQITYDPPNAEEVRAAPDGSFLVFAAEINGRSQLFRIDSDGANLRQLTSGNTYQSDSAISPDGHWIVYNSINYDEADPKHSLKRIASSGGEPMLFADGECYAPNFSPDGKYVACTDEGSKITLLSAEDGSTVRVFDAAQTPYFNCGAKWSPDGHELIYVVRAKGISNLWRQPIAGGDPSRLTDFTSDDIHNFAFSTDGTRLYLARGSQIRDAVLIKNFR
jgi:Tol biopolymer transport system component/DNA-binding winged helix-turn-helix (wHTH) protein